jgi:hypothetical protein
MLAGGDWEFGERLVLMDKRVAYSPKCRIRHLVNRHKISHKGLRDRWEGQGATAGAIMHIRGKKLPVSKRVHFSMRMLRLFGRSYRFRVAGNEAAAFRWELAALRLKGLLYKTPGNLKSRESIPLKQRLYD